MSRPGARAVASSKRRAAAPAIKLKPARMSAAEWLAQSVKERDFQRSAVDYFRRVIRPPCRVRAVVNQRAIGHLPKAVQLKVLAALVADGMLPGACDLDFAWDARHGAPGNRGYAEAELKRPNGETAPTEDQLGYIAHARAMGHVAGVARSLEDIEALLLEAGAPLLSRLPRRAPAPTAEQIIASGWQP